MSDYPYSGRNLFAEPETYFYAACADAGYLDGWKRSRADFRRRLAGAEAPDSRRQAGPRDGVLLGDLLEVARRQDLGAAAKNIEPFVVKYEVHKRLFEMYLPSGKRHSDSQTACLGTYIAFAEALVRQAEDGSLKHLSTLLKLCDALATQDAASFPPKEAKRLKTVLETEASLVAKLEAES